MSNQHHEEDHTGPIKTPKQLLLAVLYSFVLPVFIIIGLVAYVAADNKPQAGASTSPEAVEARIQKVGVVEIKDANRAARSGDEVYKAQCAACHAVGAAGAPKFGDAGAWGARIAKGYDTLLTSALKGKGAMGAQAGGEFEDFEIGRAVVHMANSAGGKFNEPKKPEAK